MTPWYVEVPPPEGQGLDLAEAKRALELFCDGKHKWELRALAGGAGNECGGSKIFEPGQIDEMLKWSRQRAAKYTIYFNLNPVNPAHQGNTAKAEDVAGRHWLFLDIDPIKPDEHKDDSADEDEKEGARDVAARIQESLGDLDWPAPVIVDSGNGWYLLYRVDLPNTKHVQTIFKKIGNVLHDRYAACAKVDRSVHNANRLAKLPGSMARKGADTKERPHRQCKLAFVPQNVVAVPAEMLSALAAEGDTGVESTAPRPENVPSQFRLDGTPEGHARYVQRALEGEVAAVALARRGAEEGLNNALNKAAFALGTLGGANVLMEGRAYAAIVPIAVERGLGAVEADRTFRSGWNSGYAKPRQLPKPNHPNGPKPVFGKATVEDQTAEKIEDGQTVILRASDVTPRKIEWLWPWRIPLGKLTTFAGVGGLGKTFVLLDIIARVTRGLPWPDMGGECAEVGQALFVSGEDDPDDTLVPRLIEVGADLTKVAFLTTEVLGKFTLADLKTLDLAVDQIGPGVRFVAIDPPTAYLGKIDDHKNSELRSLLTPLAAWAARRRLAIVFNTHVSKPQGKVEAMMRVMGSVAWVNAVRAGHMFAKDPDEPDKRVFCPMKSNLGKPRKGLSYHIVPLPNDLAKVEWLGEIETTADQAVNSEKGMGPSRKVVAKDWLVEQFRQKLEWQSDDLFQAAKEAGISRNAVFEAKGILDLPRARRNIAEDGSASFCWWVPPDWPYLTEDHTPQAHRNRRRQGKEAAAGDNQDEESF